MTLEEAKDILLKDMICENAVGLCSHECNECSFVTDATDMILGEAYSIVVKHYMDRQCKDTFIMYLWRKRKGW